MKKPTPPADLWDAIEQEYQRTIPPKGAICNSIIRKKYGCSYAQAESIIRRLIATGKIDKIGAYVYNGKLSIFYVGVEDK